jgi:hypothetical protein
MPIHLPYLPLTRAALSLLALCLGGCFEEAVDHFPDPSVPVGIADAGPDTLVSVSDPIRLDCRTEIPPRAGWKVEWDIGATGRFVAVPGGDTVVPGPDTMGIEAHVLRITDAAGNTSLDTLEVTALDDVPRVALDMAVRILAEGGGYRLRARVTDLGHRYDWAWKIGREGSFLSGRGPDTAFRPSLPGGSTLPCSVQVTDEDGNSAKAGADLVVSHWQSLGKFPPPQGFAGYNSAVGLGDLLHIVGEVETSTGKEARVLAWDPATGA